MRHLMRVPGIVILAAMVLLATVPARALPIPSTTSPGQSLAEREAELASIRQVLQRDDVSERLSAYGFTPEEVEERLAQLSPEEVHTLSQQVDQIQAAGLNVPGYIWVLLAVFLGVLIASAIF